MPATCTAIVSNMATGVEVWRTNGGENWEQVNLDGFTGSLNPKMHSEGLVTRYFYSKTPRPSSNRADAATWNFFGGEIWRMEKHK